MKRRRVVRLIAPLLKDAHQPERRSPSWKGTIREQRKPLGERLSRSPRLKPRLVETLEDSDASARLLAAGDSGRPEANLPATGPCGPEQLLDEELWPERL